MKAWKLTLICLTLITSVTLGIFAVEMGSAGKTVRVKGFTYPRTYTLDNNKPPQPWNIDLKFAPPRSVDEIDTSSILVEGVPIPYGDPINHPKKRSRIVVPFDGDWLREVVMSKLSHAGPIVPGAHLVFIEITGYLVDGETPFSTGGSCVIVVFVPDNPFGGPIF